MQTFTVGLCPDSHADSSIQYVDKGDSVTVSRSGDNHSVEVNMCSEFGKCMEGLDVEVGICPTGESCSCEYEVDSSWYDNGGCGVYATWINPSVSCALWEVRLKSLSWWDITADLLYTHSRYGYDPNAPIYPDGDSRNNSRCRGCGLSQQLENPFASSGDLVPGMVYSVYGYFIFDACGGKLTQVLLGRVLYQTTGFTSGRIVSKTSVRPPMYSVQYYVSGSSGPTLTQHILYATDYYEWSPGDYVMLVKKGTDYDGGVYGPDIVTSDNVAVPSGSAITGYFIAPYLQQT